MRLPANRLLALALAAAVALPLPALAAGASHETGGSNCLKVLRRDGNYLVCTNSDGTKTVYKVKSKV